MKHPVLQESGVIQEIIRYNVDSTLAQCQVGDDIEMCPSYEHREIHSPQWGYQRCNFNLSWAHGGVLLQLHGDVIDHKI